MVKKLTQELRVKNVPKGCIKLLQNLTLTFGEEGKEHRAPDAEIKTEAEIIVEMVELYARHKIGDGTPDSLVEGIIKSCNRPYEPD